MSPVLTAIRGWVAWFRRRKTAPLAEARARRADEIRTHRGKPDHRPLHTLYRQQKADTTRQLRAELRHR